MLGARRRFTSTKVLALLALLGTSPKVLALLALLGAGGAPPLFPKNPEAQWGPKKSTGFRGRATVRSKASKTSTIRTEEEHRLPRPRYCTYPHVSSRILTYADGC